MRIRGKGREGTICFSMGRIAWAEYGELEGEKAVRELLSFQQGYFEFQSTVTPEKENLDLHVSKILFDLVREKDEEGFLYFVARKDDLIKTKGERVSPKEIENALSEMPGVLESAIIPVPDELLGHAIKAFIVKRNSNNLTEETVRAYCAKNLEPFMVPKYVLFVDSLPKSASGKIDKKALKEIPHLVQ
jgi:non-ribosomal peptide synthetase component E (peptide arylation enzyme)